jgi:hypothetical protein
MSDMSTGYDILSTTATARFLGRCTTCDRPVAATVEGHTSDHTTIACPDCAGACKAERLYGTVVAARCNAACEGARGPACECACGGSNHGGSWERRGPDLPAGQLAAYRADKARRAEAAAARRARKVAALQDSHTLWAAAHEDVVTHLADRDAIAWSDFLTDLADRIDHGQPLSIAQIDAVRRNITRQAERDAQRAAEAVLPTSPVVTGKGVEVTGEVVKVTTHDNGYQVRLVMTVRDDRGFKVWGTVPGSLDDTIHADHEHFGEGRWTGVGARVRFVANIKASDRDETFGFFKLPRRAEVLDLAEAVA